MEKQSRVNKKQQYPVQNVWFYSNLSQWTVSVTEESKSACMKKQMINQNNNFAYYAYGAILVFFTQF